MPQKFSFLGTHTDSVSALHLAIVRICCPNTKPEGLAALCRYRAGLDRLYSYLVEELRRQAEHEDARDEERAALEAFDRAKFAEAFNELAVERTARIIQDTAENK